MLATGKDLRLSLLEMARQGSSRTSVGPKFSFRALDRGTIIGNYVTCFKSGGGIVSDQRMRLHWSPRSPFVRKVMIAAHEAGVAERLDLVRTVVAPDAPNLGLLSENPLGKIPTLTLADGRSLYDSTVIVEYFAIISPDCNLLPTHRDARLSTLRQQSLGDGILDLMLLWLGQRWLPEHQQSKALLSANLVKFDALVKQLGCEEEILRSRPFDVGHISIGCALSYIRFRFPDLSWADYQPALGRWLAEFERRPSVLAVPAIDDLNAPIGPPPNP